MSGLIDDLKESIDDILGVRDDIGAVLRPVFFVTRTWYSDEEKTVPATEIGGYAIDEEVQMLPSPGLKDYSQDLRLREGGMIKQGDLVLTNVSGNLYSESDLDGSSSAVNIEKFFRVGDAIYQVINVRPKYVVFDVQVRRLANQTRYV